MAQHKLGFFIRTCLRAETPVSSRARRCRATDGGERLSEVRSAATNQFPCVAEMKVEANSEIEKTRKLIGQWWYPWGPNNRNIILFNLFRDAIHTGPFLVDVLRVMMET